MQPEEIRAMVETTIKGLMAGSVGADNLIAKRDGGEAMLDLAVLVITDLHRTANALETIAKLNVADAKGELLDASLKG